MEPGILIINRTFIDVRLPSPPDSKLLAIKEQILGGHRQLLLLLAPCRQPLGVGGKGQVLEKTSYALISDRLDQPWYLSGI